MIRVLITAASGVIRAGLESLLRSSPALEVAGSAPDMESLATASSASSRMWCWPIWNIPKTDCRANCWDQRLSVNGRSAGFVDGKRCAPACAVLPRDAAPPR